MFVSILSVCPLYTMDPKLATTRPVDFLAHYDIRPSAGIVLTIKLHVFLWNLYGSNRFSITHHTALPDSLAQNGWGNPMQSRGTSIVGYILHGYMNAWAHVVDIQRRTNRERNGWHSLRVFRNVQGYISLVAAMNHIWRVLPWSSNVVSESTQIRWYMIQFETHKLRTNNFSPRFLGDWSEVIDGNNIGKHVVWGV